MVQNQSYFIIIVGVLLAAGAFVQGCGTQQVMSERSIDDGFYKNSAESDQFKNQVEEGFQSIRRLQNTVMYRTYLFDPAQTITRSQIGAFKFENVAIATEMESVTNAGTATVLSNNGIKAVFLTAAHTVTRADTLLHFYDTDTGSPADRVEAVSVKMSEHQFVIADNGIIGLDLIASDRTKDLALLVSNEPMDEQYNLKPLTLEGGRFDEIEWGDMVYAMGYPRGVQMITQGVVSLSNHPHRSLVMDLNINRGYSGGAVFAVRADGKGLEWIGMITSAMGERELYLSPEDDIQTEYNPDIPYRGNVYVKNRPIIYYGIAYAVDINEIEQFIRENANQIRRRGGGVSGIF